MGQDDSILDNPTLDEEKYPKPMQWSTWILKFTTKVNDE